MVEGTVFLVHLLDLLGVAAETDDIVVEFGQIAGRGESGSGEGVERMEWRDVVYSLQELVEDVKRCDCNNVSYCEDARSNGQRCRCLHRHVSFFSRSTGQRDATTPRFHD